MLRPEVRDSRDGTVSTPYNSAVELHDFVLSSAAKMFESALDLCLRLTCLP